MFKNLVGSKMLTQEDVKPVLEKFKEHLIGECVLSKLDGCGTG